MDSSYRIPSLKRTMQQENLLNSFDCGNREIGQIRPMIHQTPVMRRQTQQNDEESESDRKFDIFQIRPSPVGSSTPDKGMDLDASKVAVTKLPTADLPTLNDHVPENSYDSDVDRVLPTRCNTRWSDSLEEVNKGRERARPMTSDFFDADDYYDDANDIKDQSAGSDTREICPDDTTCADESNNDTRSQLLSETNLHDVVEDVNNERCNEDTDEEDDDAAHVKELSIFPKPEIPQDSPNEKTNAGFVQSAPKVINIESNGTSPMLSSSPIMSHFFHESDSEGIHNKTIRVNPRQASQCADIKDGLKKESYVRQLDKNETVPKPCMFVEDIRITGGGYQDNTNINGIKVSRQDIVSKRNPKENYQRQTYKDIYEENGKFGTVSTVSTYNIHSSCPKDENKRSKSGSNIIDPKTRKAKKQKKSKTKTTAKVTNPLLTRFPGNSYVLYDRPVLPPIRAEGSDTWRSAPRKSPGGYLPDVGEDKDEFSLSKKTKELQTKPQGSNCMMSTDGMILERKIATINSCNEGLGQKFVPMESKTLNAPKNPALKTFKTRSLRVVKFRAQFNRNSKLLPALGETNTEGANLPFEKFEEKENSSDSPAIIERVEQKRHQDLEAYKASLKAVVTDAKKSNGKHEGTIPSYKDIDDDGNMLINAYDNTAVEVTDTFKNGHMYDNVGQPDTPFLKRYPGVMSMSSNEEETNFITDEDNIYNREKAVGNVGDEHSQNDRIEIKGWKTDENSPLLSRSVDRMQGCYDGVQFCKNEKKIGKEVNHIDDKKQHHNTDNKYTNKCDYQKNATTLYRTELADEQNVTHYVATAPGGEKRTRMRRATRVKLPSLEEQENLRQMVENTDFIPQAPNSDKPVAYRGRQARIVQATGLQKEAFISRPAKFSAAQSRPPTDAEITRRKFQRLFKTIGSSDKGQDMSRNRHNF